MSDKALTIAFEQIGYCGKAPHRGDFIHRDLPNRFRRSIEELVAGGVAASRQKLGGRFDALYNVMPLWRFAIRPGVIDPYGAIGVLGPSVDSVGRMFPFIALAVTREAFEPVSAIDGARAFLTECEDVTLTALDPSADLDGALERLQRTRTIEAMQDNLPLAPISGRRA